MISIISETGKIKQVLSLQSSCLPSRVPGITEINTALWFNYIFIIVCMMYVCVCAHMCTKLCKCRHVLAMGVEIREQPGCLPSPSACLRPASFVVNWPADLEDFCLCLSSLGLLHRTLMWVLGTQTQVLTLVLHLQGHLPRNQVPDLISEDIKG